MLKIDNFEKFFRSFKDDAERERAEYTLPLIYDAIEQEATNRNIDFQDMLTSGRLKETVLDMEVAGILSNYLVQPTDIAGSESLDGSTIVYSPKIVITNRTLTRLGILKQVVKRVSI